MYVSHQYKMRIRMYYIVCICERQQDRYSLRRGIDLPIKTAAHSPSGARVFSRDRSVSRRVTTLTPSLPAIYSPATL